MKWAPKNVRFADLERVCDHYFESRKSKKTSHRTYKTPWLGDPRDNIQKREWQRQAVSGQSSSRSD
ncbi:hypothetical protein [Corynebacterium silvaticum]|nr:hypothetical protein [Corynebacterium silvaticum]